MQINTIIPVHEYGENEEPLLKKALDSLKGQKKCNLKDVIVNIVCPPNIHKSIENTTKDYNGLTIKFTENDGSTSFQSQINKAVENIDTPYFTILEFDDELSETYYHNVINHIVYRDDVDIFLTMLVETNKENKVVKLTNETVWSRSFVGENGSLGYLNSTSLNQYTDFKISGAVIRTEEYINGGMLKNNIVLSFQYEFLLRMLNAGYVIYTIPKIGCKHSAEREGSLFDNYSKTLSIQERKFWFETAKRESNFPTDREIDTSELMQATQ